VQLREAETTLETAPREETAPPRTEKQAHPYINVYSLSSNVFPIYSILGEYTITPEDGRVRPKHVDD
jgi:hypothetical protein